ncbi:MAG TPA: hypothetical protein VHM90_03410 [Phycisphaerae bacterium]|nr:hypothetical protein [Phycisphaerae bacterium]
MTSHQKKLALATGAVALVLLALFAGLEAGRRGSESSAPSDIPSATAGTSSRASAPPIAPSEKPAAEPSISTVPVPVDFLAVDIKPLRPIFTPGDALALRVSFRNTGTAPLRLPNNCGLYGDWLIRVQDSAGKIQTGAVAQRNGTGTESASPSFAVAPGQEFGVNAGFARASFQFVTGELDYEAIQKAIAPLPRPPILNRVTPHPLELEFPEGTYRVTLVVRFPNAVIPDGDAGRVWPHNSITSNTVEVAFGMPAAADLGSISGVAVDGAGNRIPGARVSWTRPDDFNPPPVTGSGYAKNIIKLPTPPNPPMVRSNAVYPAGTPAGVTDNRGEFVIRNLPAGIYIIAIDGAGPRANAGSYQPVEVKAGAETKLPTPINVRFGGASGGGAG